jgi:hypothetical protein
MNTRIAILNVSTNASPFRTGMLPDFLRSPALPAPTKTALTKLSMKVIQAEPTSRWDKWQRSVGKNSAASFGLAVAETLSNIATGPADLIKMVYDGSLPQLARLGFDLIKHPQHAPSFVKAIYDQDWKPLVERGEYARLAGHATASFGFILLGGILAKFKRAPKTAEVAEAAQIVTNTKRVENVTRESRFLSRMKISGGTQKPPLPIYTYEEYLRAAELKRQAAVQQQISRLMLSPNEVKFVNGYEFTADKLGRVTRVSGSKIILRTERKFPDFIRLNAGGADRNDVALKTGDRYIFADLDRAVSQVGGGSWRDKWNSSSISSFFNKLGRKDRMARLKAFEANAPESFYEPAKTWQAWKVHFNKLRELGLNDQEAYVYTASTFNYDPFAAVDRALTRPLYSLNPYHFGIHQDQAAHIVPRLMNGPPQFYNAVALNRSINYSSAIQEQRIIEKIGTGADFSLEVHLSYPETSLRPNKIVYIYEILPSTSKELKSRYYKFQRIEFENFPPFREIPTNSNEPL